MTTVGDLIVGGTVTGGVAAPTRLAAATSGDVLTSNGPGAAPSWQAGGSGGAGFGNGEAAFTPDEGRTWITMPEVSGYWAVAFANPHAGWFVGNNGQVLKISF